MSSKSVSQIFKILFQTGDVNIFVLRGVFFSRYVQLKSSFSDEKNINGETRFSTEAIEYQRGEALKGSSIIGRSWSSAKLFIVQNYTENANGDVPLTGEFKVRTLSSRCAHVMFFLCKRYFYSMTIM